MATSTSNGQPPFFLISQRPPATYSMPPPPASLYSSTSSGYNLPASSRPSFLPATPTPALTSTAPRVRASGSTPSTHNPPVPAEFRPPAHRHAHHLHSIPPREKSTRTLIIDQMLWAHGRTRFAQARAELGMTDRTGGKGSPVYDRRERPETWDEEDEAWSDGEENFLALKKKDDLGGMGGASRSAGATYVDRTEKQDLALARKLRTRAESVEKTIASMLAQPPQLLPPSPPDSPVVSANNQAANVNLNANPNSGQSSTATTTGTTRSFSHPHVLPNSVRLRILLGTLVNDFFARDFPIPPPRPPLITDASPPTLSSKSSTAVPPPSPAPLHLPAPALSSSTSDIAKLGNEECDELEAVPLPMHPLCIIAHGSPTNKITASARPPARPTQFPTTSLPSFSSLTRSVEELHAGPSSGADPYANPLIHSNPHAKLAKSKLGTIEWLPPVVHSDAASKAFGNSPISAIEAHPPKRAAGYAKNVYAKGAASPKPSFDATASVSAKLCPRHLVTYCTVCPPRSHSHSHSLPPPSSSSTTVRPVYDSSQKNGVSGWRTEDGDGSGIGSGLVKFHTVLRRNSAALKSTPASRPSTASSPGSSATPSSTPAVTTVRMAELLPRFLRLSALVAMELGREVREEKLEKERQTAARAAATRASQEEERKREEERKKQDEEERKKHEEEERAALDGDAEGDNRMDVDGIPNSSSAAPDKGKGKARAEDQSGAPSTSTSSTDAAMSKELASKAMLPPPLPIQPSTYALAPRARPYANSLRPTREWYALLTGLLTRAVLEGYLSGGWTGSEAAEVGLSVGLGGGLTPIPLRRERFADDDERQQQQQQLEQEEEITEGNAEREEDEYGEFEPDELPSLKDAALVLFPALRARVGKYAKRLGPEADFQEEMEERLQKFLDVPANVPNLAAHLTSLAQAYPVEPIERAAVRFFEAVAKWRGKPELEQYKQKSPPPPANAMSINALISPIPPSSFATSSTSTLDGAKQKTPIEKYFEQPPPPPPHRRDHRQPAREPWNSQKRRQAPYSRV